MNHEVPSVPDKTALILAIVAILAVALDLTLAHLLRFELLNLCGFCLFSVHHFGSGYWPCQSTFRTAEAMGQVAR